MQSNIGYESDLTFLEFWTCVLMCKLCNGYMRVFRMQGGSFMTKFGADGALWGESRDSPKSVYFALIFLSELEVC